MRTEAGRVLGPDVVPPRQPRVGGSGSPDAAVRGRQRPSPDHLLRDAWAIHELLQDLDADDHATRTKLLVARDSVRLEAARQWHMRGWRPITETF